MKFKIAKEFLLFLVLNWRWKSCASSTQCLSVKKTGHIRCTFHVSCWRKQAKGLLIFFLFYPPPQSMSQWL